MDKVSGKLTVFCRAIWGRCFERISEGKLFVCKDTVGAEPKGYEIYDFILKNYYRLRFSLAVATKKKLVAALNGCSVKYGNRCRVSG